jgi:HEAT repeat protein
MKNDPIETALAGLDEISVGTAEGRKQFEKALASKWNLVAAKAARIVGDAQWKDLTEDLAKAFGRFLARGGDKGCAALTAIARALFALDYDEPELYLKGMRHVQMEPVWGGSVDAAVDLRAVCAMGLVATRYPDKLRELVQLLVDPEWKARAGAVRAMVAVGSEAAALLLRLKALMGDREPDVLSDCFSGLLALEGAAGVLLVAAFADSDDEAVREAALLALGASRRADAVEWMIQKFEAVANVEMKKSLLLALATSRTEAAMGFVLGVIREGSVRMSEFAVSAMQVNRGDERLRAEVERAVLARA